MPFKLWPMQLDVIDPILTSKELVILKARQIGLTWLVLALALWLSLTKNGKMTLVFSQGQIEADEMIRRVQMMFDRLPEWFSSRCPGYGKPPNTKTIVWTNGSRIRALPSTKKAGRGFTASLVIIDEASRHEYFDEMMAAVRATVNSGGKLILLSSANGITGGFPEIWFRAVARKNKFKTVFLPWWARPDRTQEWYDQELAAAKDKAFHRQEFPATAIEAFIASGRPRFATEWIDAQSVNIREGLGRRELPTSIRDWDGLDIYELPQKRGPILISADPAEGKNRGDYCDTVIMDTTNLEEVGSLNGRWEPDEFALRLKILSDLYDADVLVERNNHGHAVLLALEKHGCSRIALGTDGSPGWLINLKTKPISIDALAKALYEGSIMIRTEAALVEMRLYQRNEGKTEAPPGKNDDRVMSRANALGWLELVGASYQTSWGVNPFAGIRW